MAERRPVAARYVRSLSVLGLVLIGLWCAQIVGAQDEDPASIPGDAEPAEVEVTGDAEIAGEPIPAPAIFTERCGRCHNDDGSPTRRGERLGTHDLREMDLDAAAIEQSIVEGREGMRAITDLTEDEMNVIVEYTVSLRQ